MVSMSLDTKGTDVISAEEVKTTFAETQQNLTKATNEEVLLMAIRFRQIEAAADTENTNRQTRMAQDRVMMETIGVSNLGTVNPDSLGKFIAKMEKDPEARKAIEDVVGQQFSEIMARVDEIYTSVVTNTDAFNRSEVVSLAREIANSGATDLAATLRQAVIAENTRQTVASQLDPDLRIAPLSKAEKEGLRAEVKVNVNEYVQNSSQEALASAIAAQTQLANDNFVNANRDLVNTYAKLTKQVEAAQSNGLSIEDLGEGYQKLKEQRDVVALATVRKSAEAKYGAVTEVQNQVRDKASEKGIKIDAKTVERDALNASGFSAVFERVDTVMELQKQTDVLLKYLDDKVEASKEDTAKAEAFRNIRDAVAKKAQEIDFKVMDGEVSTNGADLVYKQQMQETLNKEFNANKIEGFAAGAALQGAQKTLDKGVTLEAQN